jgi:hypothetical protein
MLTLELCSYNKCLGFTSCMNDIYQQRLVCSSHVFEIVRDATCIGIFVMFTAKKLLWVLKEQGQA